MKVNLRINPIRLIRLLITFNYDYILICSLRELQDSLISTAEIKYVMLLLAHSIYL